MKDSISTAHAAAGALRALTAMLSGVDAWLVGGWVRDGLLGRPTTDVDVVIAGGLTGSPDWPEPVETSPPPGLPRPVSNEPAGLDPVDPAEPPSPCTASDSSPCAVLPWPDRRPTASDSAAVTGRASRVRVAPEPDACAPARSWCGAGAAVIVEA